MKDSGPPIIRRQKTAELLLEAALNHSTILLIGPAHWGKSWLLEKEFLPLAKSKLTGCIYLDLYAIRRMSSETIDREAARWLFDYNENAFQDFRQMHAQSDKASILFHYLDKYLPDHGMLLLDHYERLPDETETNRWLEALLNYLQKRKIRLVASQRALGLVSSRLAPMIQDTKEFCMPLLSDDEISGWLSMDEEWYKKKTNASLSDIRKITGGLIGLLRDLSIWLKSTKRKDTDALTGFIDAQADTYSPSCQEVFQVISEHPLELENWEVDRTEELDKKMKLIGIFSQNDLDQLSTVSPIHEKRLKHLLTAENVMLASSSLSTTLDHKPPREVLALSLARSISNAESFGHVINTVLRFFEKIGFRATFWLQDQSHPLIWHKALQGIPDQRLVRLVSTRNLKHDNEEDEPFFRVMRGARRHPAIPKPSEVVWFPLLGHSGQMNLVISVRAGTWDATTSVWTRMIWSRFIGHLLAVVEQPLTLKAEEFNLRSQMRSVKYLRSYVGSRTIDFSDSEFSEVLSESKAQAVAVLLPINQDNGENIIKEWAVGLFHACDDEHQHTMLQATDFLKDPNTKRISSIASDYFARGLVVSHEEAFNIFPCIRKNKQITTLFFKPVRVKEENDEISVRLVLFVFYRNKPMIIDSHTQNHLTLLAQRLCYVDFLRFRWGREHEKELSVLTDIGRAMSEGLFSPDIALQHILESMKEFFRVSAISINHKVQVPVNGQIKNQVRIFKGLGYADPYLQTVYPVGEGLSEGKTGYIARTGLTLVSWVGPSGYEREEFRLADDSETLLPLGVNIAGKDQCGQFVNEGQIFCFLGTPIVWRDQETGKSEILGMLQMVNRTRPGAQRFSPRKIASARRIANLLAPVLYLMRERSRYGSQRRLKTMAALLRGLDHELANQMMKINWTIDLMENRSAERIKREWISQLHSAMFFMGKRIKAIKGLALADVGNPKRLYLSKQVNELFLSQRNPAFSTIKIDCNQINNNTLVHMDAERLHLALENLLRNAKEAVANNKVPRIRIYEEPQVGQLVRLVVSDNGPGVPMEIEERLFEPFVSGHENTDPSTMRGIGLALVSSVVEMAGGEVEYQRIGEETLFRLILPAG